MLGKLKELFASNPAGFVIGRLTPGEPGEAVFDCLGDIAGQHV